MGKGFLERCSIVAESSHGPAAKWFVAANFRSPLAAWLGQCEKDG